MVFLRSALVGLALAAGASAFSAGPALPTLSRTVASSTCLHMTAAGVGGIPKIRLLGNSPTPLPVKKGMENYNSREALGIKDDTDISYAKGASSFFSKGTSAPKKTAPPAAKRAAPVAKKAAPAPAARAPPRGAAPGGRLGAAKRA